MVIKHPTTKRGGSKRIPLRRKALQPNREANTLLEAAIHYAKLGYKIFPCKPRSKEPATPHGCKDATGDVEQIKRWWSENPKFNIGLATDGLLVVDVDGADNSWLSSDQGKIDQLATAPSSNTPRGGVHLLFRKPSGKQWRNTAGVLAEKVDTRSDGGYIVVPPSIFDGKRYRWEDTSGLSIGPDGLPEPPGWLCDELDGRSRPTGDRAKKLGGVAEGKRNATGAEVAGMLISRFDISKANEAAIAWECFTGWNLRNRPPLQENELRNIWDSITSREPQILIKVEPHHKGRQRVILSCDDRQYDDCIDVGSGFQREELCKRAADHLGFSPKKLLSLDRMIVDEAKKASGQSKTGIDFQAISCAELDTNNYDLTYLIDRTLVANQPCIIAGPKKSLKTSIAIDLGISLATRGEFLCSPKLAVRRSVRVGLMSGESGLATIQETARRIARAHHQELHEIEDLLVFCETLPRFGNAVHEEALARFIKDNQLAVIIIDPVFLAIPGTEASNLMIMGELIHGVSEICRQAKCMLILVHHTTKGSQQSFEPPELEHIAWAGFQEFTRQWLLIGRRERYEPGTGNHKLWLNVGGSAGHSTLWGLSVSEGTQEDEGGRKWQVNIERAADTRVADVYQRERQKAEDKRVREDADADRLYDLLSGSPDGETKNVLRNELGLGSPRVNEIIETLLQDGRIAECKIRKGNRKTPINAYQAVREDPP